MLAMAEIMTELMAATEAAVTATEAAVPPAEAGVTATKTAVAAAKAGVTAAKAAVATTKAAVAAATSKSVGISRADGKGGNSKRGSRCERENEFA
jgi:hypothetical protein